MSDFRLGVCAMVPTALGYVAIGLAFCVVAAAWVYLALEVGPHVCLGLWWLGPVCHVCLSSCRSWSR